MKRIQIITALVAVVAMVLAPAVVVAQELPPFAKSLALYNPSLFPDCDGTIACVGYKYGWGVNNATAILPADDIPDRRGGAVDAYYANLHLRGIDGRLISQTAAIMLDDVALQINTVNAHAAGKLANSGGVRFSYNGQITRVTIGASGKLVGDVLGPEYNLSNWAFALTGALPTSEAKFRLTVQGLPTLASIHEDRGDYTAGIIYSQKAWRVGGVAEWTHSPDQITGFDPVYGVPYSARTTTDTQVFTVGGEVRPFALLIGEHTDTPAQALLTNLEVLMDGQAAFVQAPGTRADHRYILSAGVREIVPSQWTSNYIIVSFGAGVSTEPGHAVNLEINGNPKGPLPWLGLFGFDLAYSERNTLPGFQAGNEQRLSFGGAVGFKF